MAMMDKDEISYEGLTEAEALLALYEGTRAIGMGVMNDKPDFSLADAQRIIDHGRTLTLSGPLRFDYVAGRPLKVALDTEAKLIRRVRLYDRDAGFGACERTIARALASKGNGEASTPAHGYHPGFKPEKPEGFERMTHVFGECDSVEHLRTWVLMYTMDPSYSRQDIIVASERAARAKGWKLLA